jgi:hypothetical protein
VATLVVIVAPDEELSFDVLRVCVSRPRGVRAREGEEAAGTNESSMKSRRILSASRGSPGEFVARFNAGLGGERVSGAGGGGGGLGLLGLISVSALFGELWSEEMGR